jgi:hypothetical protein
MGRRSHPGEISRGAPLPAARELLNDLAILWPIHTIERTLGSQCRVARGITLTTADESPRNPPSAQHSNPFQYTHALVTS